jgi:hypothetical protein
MARKRRDKDEVPEDSQADKVSESNGASPEPEEAAQAPRSRRGGRLFFLLALAGTAIYLVRRNQRKAELDEGIWHEAPTPPAPPTTPSPPPSSSGATDSTASTTPASPPTTA